MPTTTDALREAMDLHIEGTRERDNDKLARAQTAFLELLNQHPDHPQIIFQLGTTYLQEGWHGLAIALFRRALANSPGSPEIWNNLGSAYKGEQDNERAKFCYETAASLREHSDYYNNLSTLYVNEGEPEKGVPYANKALELNPGLAKAAWNLALLELEAGDWYNGFRHYLAGIDSGDRLIKSYSKVDNETGEANPIPFWDGEKNKRVVVYGEQGLGDEILFASCLPDLAADSESLVVDCHPRLINLFRRSFAHLDNIEAFYPDRKSLECSWDQPHEIDAVVPMGNLPFYYRSNGEFPRQTYLTPDPAKVKMYREYFESLGDGPYVGIGWMGGYKRTHANHRNAKLGHMLPIMQQGGTFISLQYTDVGEKVKRFNQEHGKLLHHNPKILKEYDYDETAAYVAALDLVIVVNTTVAHLCGAMGVPCWTLTPYARAWRYSRYPQEEMYAYGPHIKILNKHKDEAWEPFIERVAERYASYLKGEI